MLYTHDVTSVSVDEIKGVIISIEKINKKLIGLIK